MGDTCRSDMASTRESSAPSSQWLVKMLRSAASGARSAAASAMPRLGNACRATSFCASPYWTQSSSLCAQRFTQ